MMVRVVGYADEGGEESGKVNKKRGPRTTGSLWSEQADELEALGNPSLHSPALLRRPFLRLLRLHLGPTLRQPQN